jgi:hypothetical protein
MNRKKLTEAAAPEKLTAYVAGLPHPHHHIDGDGSIETLRKDEYEGHQISIRTIYKIEVDGKTLWAPLGLDNDGQLHCHSLPNYQSPSAVDMVKRLIDNFPDDFKRPRRSRKRAAGHGKSTAHPRLNRGGR